MNTDRREADPREIDRHEWDRQERAMREARAGVAGGDPALAAEREVALALRRSPGEPPADFAASVAALAAGRAPAAPADADGVEHWMLGALAAVLGLSCLGAVVRYGREWLGGFDAIAPALGGQAALNWVLAAGACMAVSWAFAQGAPRSIRRAH